MRWIFLALFSALPFTAGAQTPPPPPTPSAQTPINTFCWDPVGLAIVMCPVASGGGGGGGGVVTNAGTFAVQNTAATAAGTNAIGSVTTNPAARTIITLSVKTITTGGTAVTAIAAGGRTAGGFLQNPPSATVNLCINEIATATGTTSSGDTTCIVPGASYVVAPAAGAVSVISSDSAHPFSGYSLQ